MSEYRPGVVSAMLDVSEKGANASVVGRKAVVDSVFRERTLRSPGALLDPVLFEGPPLTLCVPGYGLLARSTGTPPASLLSEPLPLPGFYVKVISYPSRMRLVTSSPTFCCVMRNKSLRASYGDLESAPTTFSASTPGTRP